MSDEEREVVESPETPDVSEEEIGEFDDAALDKYLAEPPEESEPAKEEPTTVESPSPEVPEGETPPKEEPAPPSEKDRFAQMEEQIASLSKQVKDKEDFIQERSREIGDLRKSLREKAERLRGEVPELLVDDPVGGVERVLDAREAEERLAALEMEEAGLRNKADVLKAIPDFESKIDAIVDVAKSDGVPPQMLDAFRRNPYATSAPLLKMLADRADKEVRFKDLQTKFDSLSKSKETVADKIAQAATKPPVVTGATGGATTRDEGGSSVTEESVHELSDAELDKLLAQEG